MFSKISGLTKVTPFYGCQRDVGRKPVDPESGLCRVGTGIQARASEDSATHLAALFAIQSGLGLAHPQSDLLLGCDGAIQFGNYL